MGKVLPSEEITVRCVQHAATDLAAATDESVPSLITS